MGNDYMEPKEYFWHKDSEDREPEEFSEPEEVPSIGEILAQADENSLESQEFEEMIAEQEEFRAIRDAELYEEFQERMERDADFEADLRYPNSPDSDFYLDDDGEFIRYTEE